ncbi:hypothetical protein EDS67_13665 [candidate division KSB1 bacterium]|nr:MAG: hypothetical protein EDS67_13665 [candidate division KSB1 bacterium]MBC6952528.1 hypothetical protein [candidate division KSB1 bacterium]
MRCNALSRIQLAHRQLLQEAEKMAKNSFSNLVFYGLYWRSKSSLVFEKQWESSAKRLKSPIHQNKD